MTVITVGSKYEVYVRSPATLSNPCNKVRGEYFSKEVLPASLSCVFLPASLSLCRCRWLYNIVNESWKQHPTQQYLFCLLPAIFQTIQDKLDMLDTAAELRTDSWAKLSYEFLRMNVAVLVDQQGNSYISSVRTQYAIQKICQVRWMIGIND